VQIFKCGPDFLDPQIHAFASGRPCYNLDLGMCGETDAAWRLAAAAQDADLILVEGVMGLYDGAPSGADIARRFGLPVMAVIDAAAMAQTFGAIAHGLATFQPGLPFAGVLANHVGSAGHGQLLAACLPPGLRFYGAIPKDAAASLPERHLGLLQASEIDDLGQRLDLIADHLAATGASELPPAVDFAATPPPELQPLLAGKTIAIARDAAYAFLYPANLDTLLGLGATLKYFSPLAGESLPECDAVWLPGGYPELHAAMLATRQPLWAALRAHVDAGRPLLAECGGMMSLFDTLRDRDGEAHAMAGLLPGEVAMQPRLAALGTQTVRLPEGEFRGHTFHYSQATTALPPLARATPLSARLQGKPGEAIYRCGRLTASYLHFYFPSNPAASAALFLP
jgi:cobyrinic acid a,c-diamide synthase